MSQVAVSEETVIRDEEDNRIIMPDIARRRLSIVNIAVIGLPGEDNWVLIDAGLGTSANTIHDFTRDRFGHIPPKAILLTHGHFDHVGALEELAREWDVPVYAHPLETPYLNGTSAYPPPDATVGGGLFASLAGLFPKGPIDISERLHEFPSTGEVPFLAGWQWLHTPGHTPGHVSFWRERDRVLIAGDAVITTAQESAYAVFTQRPELHGPPRYYTIDWDKSRASAARLAALEPEILVTGHGPPLRGPQMRDALHDLADRFEEVAVPETGRYVDHPAKFKTGDAYPGTET